MQQVLNLLALLFTSTKVQIQTQKLALTRDATVNHITHHLRETGQLSRERSLENYSVVRMPGTNFTCPTSTTAQILTPEELQREL